ncbi:GntR family transcriptional regulator [Oceanicola sp. S124]|uniref:GntR family transcriptional regulator n=1 Tax=Oceanicola sp. S124 TaxID=1042378 RepID=UPI00025596C4|nr:GntR family transcriptional regulator [Oceanicola sp. S124]
MRTMTSIEKIQLSSVRLSESIGEELMHLIAAGVLKPGQRLNEVHLANSFGVSRGPVREAARELEGQGVLISKPRQGFYVTNYTPKEISDLYDAKQWLDQAMVQDFRTHGDTALFKEILGDIDSIDTAGKLEFANSLLAFRTRMTTRLSNRFLAGQILSLYRHLYIVSALLHTDHTERRMEQIIGTLRKFWAAMVAGTFDEALKVLRDDTEYWRQDVAPRFEEATAAG